MSDFTWLKCFWSYQLCQAFIILIIIILIRREKRKCTHFMFITLIMLLFFFFFSLFVPENIMLLLLGSLENLFLDNQASKPLDVAGCLAKWWNMSQSISFSTVIIPVRWHSSEKEAKECLFMKFDILMRFIWREEYTAKGFFLAKTLLNNTYDCPMLPYLEQIKRISASNLGTSTPECRR